MKKVLSFLRHLQQNNNREWFQAHKDEYLEVQARWNELTEDLIRCIGEYDPTVRDLQAKDCTFRIYRDVRFSKNKDPYKTHMGSYICRGGKKSGYSGYYFHVTPGHDEWGFEGHMLAAGDYMADPRVLRVLREDIEGGDGDFDALVKEAATAGFRLDDTWKLKRVPKGFNADGPWAEYTKYKVYCLVANVDDDFILGADLAQRVADRYRVARPLLDYVNRAIDYVREENL